MAFQPRPWLDKLTEVSLSTTGMTGLLGGVAGLFALVSGYGILMSAAPSADAAVPAEKMLAILEEVREKAREITRVAERLQVEQSRVVATQRSAILDEVRQISRERLSKMELEVLHAHGVTAAAAQQAMQVYEGQAKAAAAALRERMQQERGAAAALVAGGSTPRTPDELARDELTPAQQLARRVNEQSWAIKRLITKHVMDGDMATRVIRTFFDIQLETIGPAMQRIQEAMQKALDRGLQPAQLKQQFMMSMQGVQQQLQTVAKDRIQKEFGLSPQELQRTLTRFGREYPPAQRVAKAAQGKLQAALGSEAQAVMQLLGMAG